MPLNLQNTKFHQNKIVTEIVLVSFGEFPEKPGQVVSCWQNNSFRNGHNYIDIKPTIHA